MEQAAQNKNTVRKARWLQRAANGLSYSRIIAAPFLLGHISRGKYRSWKTASAISLLAITDGLDGRLARKAAKLNPSVASERGAWLDQMADKALTHGILGGLAISAFREKQPKAGAVLLANQAVQTARDIWVTRVRQEAAKHDVSTRAQGLGKAKTTMLLGSLITMTSPLAKKPLGETVGLAGITTGSVLAVASGISLANSLHEGIAVTEQLEEDPAMQPDPIAELS